MKHKKEKALWVWNKENMKWEPNFPLFSIIGLKSAGRSMRQVGSPMKRRRTCVASLSVTCSPAWAVVLQPPAPQPPLAHTYQAPAPPVSLLLLLPHCRLHHSLHPSLQRHQALPLNVRIWCHQSHLGHTIVNQRKRKVAWSASASEGRPRQGRNRD